MTNTAATTIIRLPIAMVIFACLILSGCGGGISGTGTGIDTSIDATGDSADTSQTPVQSPGSDTGAESTDPEAEPSGTTTDTSAMQPETVDQETDAGAGVPVTDAAMLSQIDFSNVEPSGLVTQPLVKIINVSTIELNARLEPNAEPLLNQSVQPLSTSNNIELPLGENALSLFDVNTSQALVAINPLNVAANSVTTLVVRTPPDSSQTSAIDTLPLATRVVSDAPGMALVRLVQADILGASNLSATFTLIPQGPNPGSGEVSFANMDALNRPTTDYQLVNPGDYVLNDSTLRFNDQPINLLSDSVYTLILINNADSFIYTEADSAR